MNELNNQRNTMKGKRTMPFFSKMASKILYIYSFLFIVYGILNVLVFFYRYLTGSGYPDGSLTYQIGINGGIFADIIITVILSAVSAAIVLAVYALIKTSLSAINHEYDIEDSDYYNLSSTHICNIIAHIFLILSIVASVVILITLMSLWYISASFTKDIFVSVITFIGVFIGVLMLSFATLSTGSFMFGIFKWISFHCWTSASRCLPLLAASCCRS